MTSLQGKKGNWIFITPIDGLELSKDINEEFKINRVIFVSKDKLPRIRKRLGIPVPISELIKGKLRKDKGVEKITRDFFTTSKTYAILPYNGNPKEKESDCLRLINDELNILSFSQLGWSLRRFNRRILIKISDKGIVHREISINKQKAEFTIGFNTPYSPVPYILDRKWLDFHKRFFFFDFLKLINGTSLVSKKWRTTLHRAAIFVGQSQNSNDLPSCFLWNVIVLEMLLTQSGEKIVDMLVKRAEYFLGWNEQWYKDNYEVKIRDIYKKRCDFVHEGIVNNIQIADLLFSDDLIFNVFNNIIRYQNKIKDRNHISNYSEKYEAEKLLKQKSKYQFNKFEILRKNYTEDDYKKI